MSILIKNGKIWDGEKFIRADILTETDKIAKIADNIEAEADFTYDATGKTVSPGLTDIHTHMCGISSDAFGVQPELSCIPFGVTSACDAAGEKGSEALIDSFTVKTSVFAAAPVKDNHILKELTDKRIEQYGKKIEGVKLFFDTTSPEIKDITPLAELCEYAKSRNLKVMVHFSNSPVPAKDIVRCLNKGDILTHAYHGGANNAAEDGFDCIKEAKKCGIIVDVGFAGHVHTDFEILKCGIECGAGPDTISTDITRRSAYKRGGIYGMTMCMSIAKYSGMSEERIFQAVTSAPAKAVNKENSIGYLKEGRNADISVFDENGSGFDLIDNSSHRITSAGGYRCVLTVVNGETVYRI